MDATVHIDGKTYQATAGEMVIAVADRAQIAIPRFCYHKNLSIAANCRMCLIEVEGVANPQPACSTPVSDNMRVYTCSDKAKSAQQGVMSFLLINHPLDCPICDQGGECELQDVAMDYGSDISRFTEGKRVVVDKDIGPLIQTEMTRCIHCTRCVRFGSEIAGIVEMGATHRGENLKIEPYLKSGVHSELSGNMIDICPVGALTSKPFRYSIRSWEIAAKPMISPHDNVGSHIYAQVHNHQVKRVVAREHSAINEMWISDRDRFGYEGLYHKQRLVEPKIKVEQQWQMVNWEAALDFTVKGLSKTLGTQQAEQLGALCSARESCETYYLLQKLMTGLGSDNVDHRIDQNNFSLDSFCRSTHNFEQLAQADYVLVIGGYPRLEQPMLNHRLRQASLAGAVVDVINMVPFTFNLAVRDEHIIAAQELGAYLATVCKALLEIAKQSIPTALKALSTTPIHHKIAEHLIESKQGIVLLGEHLAQLSDFDVCIQYLKHIAHLANVGIINASLKANALGAHLAGALPGQNGHNAYQMCQESLEAYLLLDIYPEYDCVAYEKTMSALRQADFVVAINAYHNAHIDEVADVILPVASYYETPGTYINLVGMRQFTNAAVQPYRDAKPAWKIFKALADGFELRHFEYTDFPQITKEIDALSLPNDAKIALDELSPTTNQTEISIIWQCNPYSSDAIVRHATSLQQTPIAKENYAKMTQNTQNKLKDHPEIAIPDNIPIVIDENMADNCIFILTPWAKT